MALDAKHLLLGFAILYSLIWVGVGLKTGAMPSALGKNHRASNPRAYWLQMALRGGVGALAAYILLTTG
ncbi:MAG: hypothetical protein P4L57_11495 [Rhizomicrobium sp.]|nr:hypothetical protein [Rhizomicrobium sp.]